MNETDNHKVVTAYRRMASVYDWVYRLYLKKTMAVAIDLLHPDGHERILDVACGTGELERHVMDVYPAQAIVGVDLTDAMLVRARSKLASFPHVVFHQGTSTALPFPDASFDCVITCSAFHYMRQPERVIEECARVLTPGGRFIMIDWTRDAWQGRVYDWFRRKTIPSHYKVTTEKEVRELCQKSGLEVSAVKRFSVVWWWRMLAIESRKQNI
ncbi:MAG: hypothetical protein COV45_03985 [Deltaproteobacteria bacterium CG11_big_fil_rev_8_21_14_0_20_47_16]|nr:MAG: hypothetical protein COV45_03985 [Deltaproteobacteria bacterium CG11_big_fil_rev_8_21_14_0_20_47_16]